MEGRLVACRYRLIRPLGRGGMGAVWLGEDQLTGRQAAVKELRPPAGISDAEQDVFRRRALAEARSAARLTHPNAVTLYDVIPASPADDAVYLIMEYVDGATLAQVIEREGPLSEPRAAGIALQMLSILDAARALGIVHRDIKPANIMITAAGQVKLADFGIAHMVGGTRLTGSGVIGTPAYMAPEQLQGLDITPAVDLWALGATLYNAVAGLQPVRPADHRRDFPCHPDGGPATGPVCGPPLAPVITRLLVRDPAQRMSTQQARAQLTGPVVPPPPGPPTMPAQAWAPDPGRTAVATSPGNTWAPGQGTPVAAGPAGSPPGQPAGESLPGGAGRCWPAPGRSSSLVAAAVIAVTLLHGSGGNEKATTGASAAASLSASTGTGGTPARSAPASSTPASGSALSVVPAAYLGHWRGTLTENNGLQGPQTADLKLTGGSVNAIVGSSSYTSGGCAYNLRLISSSTTQVELHEEVTAGACEPDYAIIAVKDGKLTENVYVISPDYPPDFTGTLTKI